jgi:hypothetical protein
MEKEKTVKEKQKRIADRRQQSDELIYRTDGKNHQIEAKGDAAKGLVVAVCAVGGFAAGFLFAKRS